jgi:hypothetical protein
MGKSITRVVTGKVRLSYVYVWETRPQSEEDITAGLKPKYSCQIIIDKTDKQTIASIEKAVTAAIETGKTKLANKKGIIPKDLKLPLRCGDTDEEKAGEELYKNKWFLNANAVRQPGVVDSSLNRIIDQDALYSGCYGRVSLEFYAFSGKSKGIAVGLGNIQKLADGERLGGGATAEEDFDVVETETDTEEM